MLITMALKDSHFKQLERGSLNKSKCRYGFWSTSYRAFEVGTGERQECVLDATRKTAYHTFNVLMTVFDSLCCKQATQIDSNDMACAHRRRILKKLSLENILSFFLI
jgi:hypothetical protein